MNPNKTLKTTSKPKGNKSRGKREQRIQKQPKTMNIMAISRYLSKNYRTSRWQST